MAAPVKQRNLPNRQAIPSSGGVLVVAPDTRERGLLHAKLSKAGFRVDAVEDSADGLIALQNAQPDLILNDLRQPGESGIRAVGDFHSALNHSALKGEESPIVVLSKHCETSFKLACFEAGACDYLTRPIDDEELIKRLSLHIDRAKRLRSLRDLSLVDELTGIANRRAIILATKCEISRAERYERPLSLLLVDVDDFKAVNDSHGHLVGDQVLRRVANILNQAVRTTDTVGRLGGDEFVLLLPETDELAAMQIANRLSQHIRTAGEEGSGDGSNFSTFVPKVEKLDPSPLPSLHLSASIGIATTRDPRVTVEELMAMADERMYRSKRSRRESLAL